MHWMQEEGRLANRLQPERMLDQLQTVISVGMRHTPPPYTLAEAAQQQKRGIIAAYAHGHDYHDVMKKRLKQLALALDDLLGKHDQRVYVDTAPVLEHALAEEGGLGWQGKHSLTISREYGSWLMLGEIFTTADIQPDTPATHHCGSCTACIDICPSQAIVAPYVVDARRCISYLTIEYRGFIDVSLRPLMGNRIYGCDDCQAICPWNRHAASPDEDFLKPAKENILPELVSLLELDDAAFRLRFSKSPVKRTGRAAVLRNVCIALGNSGNADVLPAVQSMLSDEAAVVRGHAAWAVAELVTQEHAGAALEQLQQCAGQEQETEVLHEIQAAADKIRILYVTT